MREVVGEEGGRGIIGRVGRGGCGGEWDWVLGHGVSSSLVMGVVGREWRMVWEVGRAPFRTCPKHPALI